MNPPLMMNLPDGDEAVPFTTAMMHECAQRLARERGAQLRMLVERCAGPNVLETVFAIMKQRYRFEPDPSSGELFRNHAAQLRAIIAGKQVSGDCDDRAVVIAAFLIACGFPYAFFTVSRDSGPYEHVLCVAGAPGSGWFPLDPQETDKAGEWPADIARRAVWMPGDGA